jgi:hypothetical protein
MTTDSSLTNLHTKLGRKIKGRSSMTLAEIEYWPTPDEGAFTEEVRNQYINRKNAVKAYLNGFSDEALRSKYNISLVQVYRLVTERCLETHPDGLIYGWRGLIPHLRIKSYTRTKSIQIDSYGYGTAGSLQLVLNQHPDLRAAFEKKILKSPAKDALGEQKKTRQAQWKWFLDQLRKFGHEQNNLWPFNTKNMGYVAVCKYINKVLAENPKQATRVLGGIDAEKKFIAGDGVDRPVYKVFQRVEMDAHKLDGRFCVMMPTLQGDYHPKIIHRIWVIAIIEIVSRAVLGYYLSMAKEVSKDDVLRTIRHALTTWHQKNITFSESAYIEDAGLPSGISSDFVGICWDETNVDGALAETCKHVETIFKDVVGSTLITPYSGYSSRRSKDDRPFVERFFKTLTSLGFQRLSNTTGSKPGDKKGYNPEKVALTSQFQIEYAEELLDVLIANYNATPHSGLGHRTPLEYLQFISSRKDITLRRADEKLVQGILAYRKKCRVNGSLKEGRKPFVNFDGAKYTNEILQQRFDLINNYIWVINHLEDDARVVQASSLDGKELGVLRASPPWHRFPHSLKVRRAINAALRNRKFILASNADAVEAFLEYAESQPNTKLPVHPAYLEMRRILSFHADQNIGKSTLENALKLEVSKHDCDINKLNNDAKSEIAKKQKLPPRRMAASD